MIKNKLLGMLSLFRPELTLAAGICVLVGQVLAGQRFPPFSIALLGFLCAVCLSGAALILNDVFDFEVDKINAPQRALPSGAVSRTEALVLTGLVSLIGLAAALALGMPVFIISVIFWLIGILYNWRYKQSGLPGNLMVSASVAITFILGAVTVQQPWNRIVWVFSLIAFFVDLGEEIAGDAMDMAGDKARGSRSVALLKGKSFAVRMTLLCWSMVILLSLVPLILNWLGAAYLVMVCLMDCVIVFFGIRLYRSETPASGRAAMRGVYLGATLGLIGFLIANLF